jgi:chromosome partitioning protein
MERERSALLIDADPRGDARTWASFAGEYAPPSFSLPSTATTNDLRAIALGIDVCIVDCPANDGARLSAVLEASDFCVVPCGPSPLDVWSIGSTFDRIRAARARNPVLGAAILINRGNASTTLGRTVGDQLAHSGFPVLRGGIRQRVALVEALGAGISVTRALPDSHAAAEVEGVLDEVVALTSLRDAAAHPVQ